LMLLLLNADPSACLFIRSRKTATILSQIEIEGGERFTNMSDVGVNTRANGN